ncbi:MAG TPA: hypothetical protein VNQ48_09110, partial [Microbacteriaceae bacterium]|nr:hypothetical protein [Microbacteriaceae bacterium]
KGIRRAAIIVVIASLVIAALLGIISLIGGTFGDLQGKILLTTLTIGLFGITILCHLAIVSRAARVVGYVGLVASLAAIVPPLTLIWTPWELLGSSDGWWRAFGVLTVLAVSLAQTNLLLLLVARPQRAVRVILVATLAMMTIVAIMIILPILTDGDIPGRAGDDYWRWFAAIAILDVLGTITLPVIGLVLKPRGAVATAPTNAPPPFVAGPSIPVPAGLAERIAISAAAAGEDPERHALAALERAFPTPEG